MKLNIIIDGIVIAWIVDNTWKRYQTILITKKKLKSAKKVFDHQINDLALDSNLRYPALHKKYEKISVMRDFINGLFTKNNEHYEEIIRGMGKVKELCDFVE